MADDDKIGPTGKSGRGAPADRDAPLGFPTWASQFYQDGRGKILPVGVVFIPVPAWQKTAGSATHNVQEHVPPGGELLLVGDGGIYVRLAPDNPYWQQFQTGPGMAEAAQELVAPTPRPDDPYRPTLATEYLNGQQVTPAPVGDPFALGGKAPKFDKDGYPVTDAGAPIGTSFLGRSMLAGQAAQSTWSALSLPQNINPNTRFLLSQGAGGLAPAGVTVGSDGQGNYTYTSRTDTRQDQIMGPRGQWQNQPTSPRGINPQQKNYMTLQDALQWFVDLSVRDKDAYNSLVVLLNKGGYFGGGAGQGYLATSQLPLNTISPAAAQAFVRAGTDLSVAQSAGETSDLMGWLQKRTQGYQDFLNSGAGFIPGQRSYTDPATLKATAKAVAQQALGRKLTDAEEARFESVFRGKENAAYGAQDAYGRAKAVAQFTSADGATLAPGTPMGYTAPDAGGQADAYLDDPRFAQEKAGYSALQLTKGLMAFLGGGQL